VCESFYPSSNRQNIFERILFVYPTTKSSPCETSRVTVEPTPTVRVNPTSQTHTDGESPNLKWVSISRNNTKIPYIFQFLIIHGKSRNGPFVIHPVRRSTPQKRRMAFPNLIFGYGCLICPHSRTVTAPTSKGRQAIPVQVDHLQPIWSIRWDGVTFLGIRVVQGRKCVGVLIPVTNTELEEFDKRECGYERIQIDPVHVHALQQPSQAGGSVAAYTMDEGAPIWVYVPQKSESATEDAPIYQSYIDVILRGCLSISPEFAREFLLTTSGWHQEHLHEDHHSRSSSSSSSSCVHWINDRHNPRYVRADSVYSKAHADYLDRLLELYRPEFFDRKEIQEQNENLTIP